MQLRFPLPAGYFAKFDLLPDEVHNYQTLASDIVRETKRDLDHYIKDGRNLIDAHTWKLAKSKERLHCYRRRHAQGSGNQRGLYSNSGANRRNSIGYTSRSRPSLGATSSTSRSGCEDHNVSHLSASTPSLNDIEVRHKSLRPTVIGYGIMDGTVDDLVYGLYQSSTTEMKTMSAFLEDNSLIDSAVLKTIRQTRSSYLGLKWKLSRTVGGNRDCCYMEYVGMSEDANGQRYGYHVMESVDVRNCPHFDDNSIVRTNVSFCFIFRMGKLADQIEVFMEGAYDSSADVLTAGGVGDCRSTMDMLFNLPSALVGAEAKKISAMVAKQSGALRGASSKNQSGNHCSICRAKSGLLSSRTTCQTCGAVICSKCRIRKVTFSKRGKVKVSCCRMCMVMVKDQSPFGGERLEQQEAKPKQDSPEKHRSRSSNCCDNTKLDVINPSISTMSLADTELSSSYSSWQSSSVLSTQSISMSSLHSDHDDSLYSSNAPSLAMGSLERKMPALMESELPPHTSVTCQSEQQRQYEQQQQQQQFLIRQHVKQNSGSSAPNPRHASTREGLYNQMLELQMQAEWAYNLTNQNANMMNSRQ